MPTSKSAKALFLSFLTAVLLAACGSKSPLDPNASTTGNAGTQGPSTAGNGGATATAGATGSAGASGLAGTTGLAGASGVAGASGSPGHEGSTLTFAPGSTVIRPHDFGVYRPMPGYGCGPPLPFDSGYSSFSVTVRGFELLGDPSCNLYITINPVVPTNTDLAISLGEPQMVSYSTGPSGEIVDPSFDIGGSWGAPTQWGSVNVDVGQGARSRPLFAGSLTLTLLALPTRYGDTLSLRVRGPLVDGGFLDFTVSGVLYEPPVVTCPAG